MTHTPAPWKIEGNTLYALCDDGVNRFQAQFSAGFTEYPKRRGATPTKTEEKEVAANLQVCLAAPDMLEALEAAIECGMVPKSSVKDGGAVKYSRQVQVADMIRAAIAKAKGQ